MLIGLHILLIVVQVVLAGLVIFAALALCETRNR